MFKASAPSATVSADSQYLRYSVAKSCRLHRIASSLAMLEYPAFAGERVSPKRYDQVQFGRRASPYGEDHRKMAIVSVAAF
jgi:hypothetical protein